MNYQRIDTNEPYPPDTIFLNGCDGDGHWEVNYVRQQESEGVVVEIMWPRNPPDSGPLIVGHPKGFLAWLGDGTDSYRLTRVKKEVERGQG